jgi:hypothetical protein
MLHSLPTYTNKSLWRNESICLQELVEPSTDFSRLLVGINWCEPPDNPNIRQVSGGRRDWGLGIGREVEREVEREVGRGRGRGGGRG